MKKLLSVLLTICMVAMSMNVVFADDAAATTKVSMVDVSANSGDTIQVPINIEGSANGVATVSAKITYDSSLLTYTGLESGIYQGTVQPSGNNPGEVLISTMATQNYTGDGALFTVSFTVNDTEDKNVVTAIGLEVSELYYLDSNYDLINIDRVVTGSAVTINSFVYGDVNGDGALTAEDAAIVLQYALNGTGITNINVADVNQNGLINSQDSTMILQKVLDSSYVMPCEK